MRLIRATLAHSGPFDRVELPFADEQGRPRALSVVHGGAGVGKTTVLHAVAVTRPGHAVAQLVRGPSEGLPAHAACSWQLGADDPARPHPLSVASPHVRFSPDDETEALRRKEQAYYDRVASDGGFAFLLVPSARWFSRQPIVLGAPVRGVARYDVKSPLSLDDAARADLARETKQALAYAAISEALSGANARDERRFDLLGAAMRAAVDRLSDLVGLRYRGVDPHSLEPVFTENGTRQIPFDALPTRARHLVAFGALSVRVLWAAYPDQDPRESEGVVAIDDVDLYQDAAVLAKLAPALREALPQAQWLLTTASPQLAASVAEGEVIALRRLGDSEGVGVFSGQGALTH